MRHVHLDCLNWLNCLTKLFSKYFWTKLVSFFFPLKWPAKLCVLQSHSFLLKIFPQLSCDLWLWFMPHGSKRGQLNNHLSSFTVSFEQWTYHQIFILLFFTVDDIVHEKIWQMGSICKSIWWDISFWYHPLIMIGEELCYICQVFFFRKQCFTKSQAAFNIIAIISIARWICGRPQLQPHVPRPLPWHGLPKTTPWVCIANMAFPRPLR